MTTFILASASPARLTTLRSAGFDPTVMVSGVDEYAILTQAHVTSGGVLSHADAVLALARAKAEDVARTSPAGLVLGCDSMLEFDGEIVGKPGDVVTAVTRWRAMRGHSGVLHTGHWLIDTRDGRAGKSSEGVSRAGVPGAGATSVGALGATASTIVHFAHLSDMEIDAYVATGEPLNVAGGFTIDGLGGSFVERIEGDHHNVVGVSLPLVRRLLGELGFSVTEMWH